MMSELRIQAALRQMAPSSQLGAEGELRAELHTRLPGGAVSHKTFRSEGAAGGAVSSRNLWTLIPGRGSSNHMRSQASDQQDLEAMPHRDCQTSRHVHARGDVTIIKLIMSH